MALSDDLKTLEELHSKGHLTDQEFTAAKASAIASASGASSAAAAPARALSATSKVEKKSSAPRIILGLILLGLLWVYVQSRLGQPASTVFKEAVHLPVDLRTETFSVPARGWKAIAIQVPYSGSVTIEAQVLGRGNAMEMFLTDQNGVDTLNSSGRGTYIAGFYTEKGTSFEHTAQMNPGQYFFIVRDRHLGIFSAAASDISLKAKVEP